MFDDNLALFVKEKKIDFLSYTTADISFVRKLEDFLGFHIIRDPRDIVVSAYFSHLYSHPTKEWPALVNHRKKLQKASKEEGLHLEMEFRKGEFECLYDWDYSQSNVLELKMEDMIRSPYETIVKAFSYLRIVDDIPSMKKRFIFIFVSAINRLKTKGLIPIRISQQKVPVDAILLYSYQNSFSRKSKGRKQGEENIKSHYRKGIAGDWKNHFTKEHIYYFKKNYNDLLIKLGYETTKNW
jgi:hypothetical protein